MAGPICSSPGFRAASCSATISKGGFEDVTEAAGLRIERWGVTGAWVDIDNDGWLDLYVITYCDWLPDHRRRCMNDQQLRDICGPSMFPGARDYLWRNRATGRSRISPTGQGSNRSRALGVVVADFDEDGWMDIYVANDVQENHLYRGGPKFPLESVGLMAGVAFSDHGERQGSMGVDVGDFDGDGRIDIWYTNYSNQDNSLMRNVDAMGFIGAGSVSGMFGISRVWVGFGTGFADFDSDGWADLFVANGHVAYERLDSPYYQPAQLFRNEAGQRFVDVSDQGGPYFSVPHVGRGAASATWTTTAVWIWSFRIRTTRSSCCGTGNRRSTGCAFCCGASNRIPTRSAPRCRPCTATAGSTTGFAAAAGTHRTSIRGFCSPPSMTTPSMSR
jgi:enediyne biosynthesis protein E4